jgi:hypothetical protein
VIKQICPHCLRPVSVADDAAGKDATCPECGKAFPVQARYNPVVAPTPPTPNSYTAPATPEPVPMSTVPPVLDRPAPPPGYVPPPASNQLEPPLPPTPPVPSVPPGYTRSIGLPISPKMVAWLPALCLTLALIATFFSWVGAYAGRYPVYSQGPWRALFGVAERDPDNLEFAKKDPTNLVGQGQWLDKLKSDWGLVLPYLVLLILATVLAWAERGFATLDKNRLPPPLRWVTVVWPYRIVVIAALATISFVLIVTQVINGFGLQRAAQLEVKEHFATDRQKAGASESALADVEILEKKRLDAYHLERTTWLYLGLGLHLLAVLAIVARVRLDARGNKPPPRIVIQY